ncbi:hypothetical protein FZB88_14025 [Enterococcus faecium]|nr:hypothetical protein B4W81_07315 [Enterococcus faecium]DAM03567.1 MAG TPA: hypothetical protein [Caudoviricetes sp.]MCZ1195196.1 hypothetical protein [Enterococcus faecium]MCZ1244764.1 hypothetical protein [Enterococcus faecium]MCZ1394246.1 hypothetical protein [Enterococcus faecium]
MIRDLAMQQLNPQRFQTALHFVSVAIKNFTICMVVVIIPKSNLRNLWKLKNTKNHLLKEAKQ